VKRSVGVSVAVLIAPYLAIPFYLYFTRRNKERFLAIGAFTIVILGWYALHYAGFYMLWAIENL